MVPVAMAVVLALPAGRLLAQAKSGPASEAEITFNTALTHLREGRVEEALETFKKAIKQDGRNPYSYKGLGVAYAKYADKCAAKDDRCRNERYTEAAAAARRALEINPYYVDARSDLGTWLLQSGKREEGKKELKAAYEDPTNPTPAQTARNLGQAYSDEKNYAQAQTWFQAAIGREERYGDAYVLLARTLVEQNKLPDAVSALEMGAKAVPDDLNLQYELGQAYYRAGRFGDARARWEGVVAKDAASPAGRAAAEQLRKLQR
jgi:tetratricopeptide (TPR) repeat protein